MENFKLYNGVEVPTLAYGTQQLLDDTSGYGTLKLAVESGYRHIDTASSYRNEALIAKVIESSGIKREEFFITTKLWNSDQGYERTIAAFEKSCKELKTDYLDLYLIHWPIPLGRDHDYKQLNRDTWRAFEKLYKEKRVRAIGVANFLVHHLVDLETKSEILPMVNQIEFNPYYQQRPTVAYCQSRDILVEAWAPLMRGKAEKKEELIEIAKKYDRSVRAICFRYCLQKGILPIARAFDSEQIRNKENILNFQISNDDLMLLDRLNTFTEYTFHPDLNKDWFK